MQDNYPKIVYKYRSWNDQHGKEVLTKFQLYLSSPKDFNDPFDCRIPTNYKCLTNEEIEIYANEVISRQLDKIIHNGLDPKVEREKIIWQLKNDIDNFQKKNEVISFNTYDDVLGILSLSIEWDNLLLWSHYADKHYGFCVGFFEKGLRESNYFSSGGPIIYPESNEYPLINPNDVWNEEKKIHAHFDNTHTKSLDWKSEKEFRLIKIFRHRNVTIEERQINFDPALIAEVIIGLRTTPAVSQEIISICKMNKIKVFKTKQVEFKFALEKVEI